jgi:hypothetical protein
MLRITIAVAMLLTGCMEQPVTDKEAQKASIAEQRADIVWMEERIKEMDAAKKERAARSSDQSAAAK